MKTRPQKLLCALLTSSALIATPTLTASAQEVPTSVPYQGFLSNQGAPVNGDISLTFRGYESLNEPTSMWTETLTTTVTEGAFSVYLGEVNNGLNELVRLGRVKYITVAINNGVETPRQALGAVPYALMSYNSARLQGYEADEFVRAEQLTDLNERLAGAISAAEAAQTTASGAQNTASAAQTAANTAQTTANTAQTTATEAQNTASAAQTAANTAQTTATEAQNSASAAQTAANTAQATATGAQNTASAAQTAANTAQTTATGAQNTANAAQAAAATAQATATGAQNTANAAQAAAATAQATAEARTTTEQVQAMIDALTLITEADVERLIDDRGYLSAAAINDLINTAIANANGITPVEVERLIAEALEGSGYLTAATATTLINQLIDARGFATTAQAQALAEGAAAEVQTSLSQLITQLTTRVEALEASVASLSVTVNTHSVDLAAALTSIADHEARITALEEEQGNIRDAITTINATLTTHSQTLTAHGQSITTNSQTLATHSAEITTLQAAITDLRQTVQAQAQLITNLTTQVSDLQTDVVNLSNNAGGGSAAEVLGLSDTASTGRFSFNGQTGLKAANEMCKSSFASVATAHLCTHDEVTRALALGNVNSAVDDVETWTVAAGTVEGFSGTDSLYNTCQNLLYTSSDAANGTSLRVNINYQSIGGGGGLRGDVVNVRRNRNCNTALKVMCCR